MRNRVVLNIENIFLYLIGITLTFQLITIFGINLSTWALLVFALWGLIKQKRIHSDWKVMSFIISIVISLIGNLLLSPSLLSNISEWKRVCLSSSIVFGNLFLVYCMIKNINSEKMKIFFRGVYYSCCIQVAWCYLQLVLYMIADLNLNELLFVKVLDMWVSVGGYNVNQQFTLTGLNINAGIMTPVLLIAFFGSERNVIKLLIFIMFFLTGNSTTLISGIVLTVLLFYQHFLKSKKISFKVIITSIILVLAIFFILIIQPSLFNRAIKSITILIGKFSSINTRQYTEGSTFVHFRYYQSMPYVLSTIGIFRFLIGFGFRCGGMPFVLFYNQYPEAVYGTESDPISILYGLGIIGFVILYHVLFKIIKTGQNVDKNYVIFELVIVISGVFYSLQMNWLLLVEFLLLEAINRNIRLGDLIKKRGYLI